MPSRMGAAHRTRAVRRPRRLQPGQHPNDRGSGRADRLGRVARRRSRPRLWSCPTTRPASTKSPTTLPHKRQPRGKPLSAGTRAGPTGSRSSDSPRYERSSWLWSLGHGGLPSKAILGRRGLLRLSRGQGDDLMANAHTPNERAGTRRGRHPERVVGLWMTARSTPPGFGARSCSGHRALGGIRRWLGASVSRPSRGW